MVFRVEKNRNYCTINNTVIWDNRISLKAKGLLMTMLALPDDWNYSIEGLSKIMKEGKDAIRSAIQELEEAGYVQRIQDKSESGKFNGYIYIIHEAPILENTELEPLAENPTTVEPTTENPTQQNIYKHNTNIQTSSSKEKECDSDVMRHGNNHLVKLTNEEYRKLMLMFGVERIALMIQRLDYHISKTGTYYPSHYETIAKWIVEDDVRAKVGSSVT